MIEQNRAEDAAVAFQRVVELKPHDPIAHSDLGAALEHREIWTPPRHVFAGPSKSIRPVPKRHSNLGSVLGKQDKFDEAAIYCRRAIELNPLLAEAHNNLSTALHKEGGLVEAAECVRTAIRLNPDNVEVA